MTTSSMPAQPRGASLSTIQVASDPSVHANGRASHFKQVGTSVGMAIDDADDDVGQIVVRFDVDPPASSD
jgi:hypothetical protein